MRPGHRPKERPFCRYPQRWYHLTWTTTVKYPSLWWYDATSSTRWPRSVGRRELRLVGAQWDYVLVSLGFWSFALTVVFSCGFCGLFDFVSVPSNIFLTVSQDVPAERQIGSEQSCLYQFVLVVSLGCSNCSLVADDQLHMIAYVRCDFLLHGLVSTHTNCSSREVLLQ